MSEPVQNALLITAAVCAVLALLIGLWLAVNVISLRRQRFISARVLAGAGAQDGQGPQRRSMASRQGEQRRYTAPAVRTGVDSVTMKRALDRAATRQEKSLARMRQEIDHTRTQMRQELERTARQVKEVTQGFDRVQQQATSDTQAIRQVSTDATQNLQRMTSDVAGLDERLVALQKQVAAAEERLQATGSGVEELRTSQQELAEWRQGVSRELDEATAHRAALVEEAASDRKLLDTIDRGLGGVAGLVDELRRSSSSLDERTASLGERLTTLSGTADSQAQRVEQLESGATQLGERTAGLDNALRGLSETGDDLDRRLKRLEHSSESALTEVALVRYDAFGDMGGRMSFSVALLDAVGDGLIITSLNGRAHSQTYAKSVTEGRGTTRLTAEEEQAVAAARGMEVQHAPEQAVRPLRQRRT
ncbi:DUF4446 family protein [Kytococcus sedentarius]|uniref:DUF4446 family protein n=1 Tax=Kytococcus sedentarius TaxID=1276 RepID=UPI0035BC0EB8